MSGSISDFRNNIQEKERNLNKKIEEFTFDLKNLNSSIDLWINRIDTYGGDTKTGKKTWENIKAKNEDICADYASIKNGINELKACKVSSTFCYTSKKINDVNL